MGLHVQAIAGHMATGYLAGRYTAAFLPQLTVLGCICVVWLLSKVQKADWSIILLLLATIIVGYHEATSLIHHRTGVEKAYVYLRSYSSEKNVAHWQHSGHNTLNYTITVHQPLHPYTEAYGRIALLGPDLDANAVASFDVLVVETDEEITPGDIEGHIPDNLRLAAQFRKDCEPSIRSPLTQCGSFLVYE